MEFRLFVIVDQHAGYSFETALDLEYTCDYDEDAN
jgi:hypothetical protein